jgi:hypothetical protein
VFVNSVALDGEFEGNFSFGKTVSSMFHTQVRGSAMVKVITMQTSHHQSFPEASHSKKQVAAARSI